MVQIIADLVVIFIALKLAQLTGGVEFNRVGSAIGAAIVCWFILWLAYTGLLQEFPKMPNYRIQGADIDYLAQALGIQLIITMVGVALGCTIVPGTLVRRFIGLFVASSLIVVFSYVTTSFVMKG